MNERPFSLHSVYTLCSLLHISLSPWVNNENKNRRAFVSSLFEAILLFVDNFSCWDQKTVNLVDELAEQPSNPSLLKRSRFSINSKATCEYPTGESSVMMPSIDTNLSVPCHRTVVASATQEVLAHS